MRVARGRAKPAVGETVEGPWALPEGWRWERLGDACLEPDRGAPSSRFPQTFRYTDVGGIGEGIEAKIVDTAEAPSRARQFVRIGDTLLSGVRVNLRRTVFVDKAFTDIASTAFVVLTPGSCLFPRFAYYWCIFDQFVDRLIPLQRGNQPPAVTESDVRDQPIPIPPFDIQHRIVARIDDLFTELDDGEAALARARIDLGTWRKALLKAAVIGELTADWRAANPPTETGADLLARILDERRARWLAEPNNKGKILKSLGEPEMWHGSDLPSSWARASLPQIGEFGRGKSKHRPRDDAKLYGGPYPFVQTGIVAASQGRIRRFDQTYTDFGLAQSKLWPAGTLCITIAANIAKTGVLQFDACFPDSVVGLSCASGIRSEYIELVIRSLQSSLEDDAPATAQKNINLETLSVLSIPIPPSEEQAAIVAAHEEAEIASELLMHRQLDSDVSTLRQSILAAAFRGELVA